MSTEGGMKAVIAALAANLGIAVAKFVGAHDFIQRLPRGYNTVLGERGQAAWERQQAGWLKRSFQLPGENPLAPLPGDP